MVQLTEFDIADYLNTKEDIAAYISQILEDGDSNELFAGLCHLAKSRNIPESLYSELCTSNHPKFTTVQQVCRALGINITAVTAQ